MVLTHDAPSGIRADYPEPLWIQAVNLISGEIASGALQPGSRLPPERELCQQLGISRVTLRKALNKLVENGVLSPSHGRGWYVADAAAKATPAANKEWPNYLESFSETAARVGLIATSRVLRAELSPASLDEAETLMIAAGTPLFRLHRVRMLNDVPIAIDATEIPANLAPGVASVDFTTASLFQVLADANVQPVRADATIEAIEADEASAELLQLEIGKPLLVMKQLAIDNAERPLFSSTIRYAGDRYRLRTFFARNTGTSR